MHDKVLAPLVKNYYYSLRLVGEGALEHHILRDLNLEGIEVIVEDFGKDSNLDMGITTYVFTHTKPEKP